MASNSDDWRGFLMKELECPVCLEVPETTPIFQCSKDHIHCNSCHPKLNHCPICRSPILMDSRNLLAEKIHEKLLQTCRHCSVRLVNIKEHETQCEMTLIKKWKGKMLEACKNGETKVVQLLLERCNSEESGLNTRDVDGWTPLMFACYNGHKDVVKLLLENSKRNIDLNARSNAGSTAFMFACKSGHKDVVKLLLENSVVKDIDILTGRAGLNNDMKAFIDKQQIKR